MRVFGDGLTLEELLSHQSRQKIGVLHVSRQDPGRTLILYTSFVHSRFRRSKSVISNSWMTHGSGTMRSSYTVTGSVHTTDGVPHIRRVQDLTRLLSGVEVSGSWTSFRQADNHTQVPCMWWYCEPIRLPRRCRETST